MEVSPYALRLFADLLLERTGQELAMARNWRIETALRPLLKERNIETLERLALAVAGGRDPALADAVVDALLNNETYFYRDPAAFRLLDETVFARLAEARRATRTLRIWCAGCSTGQEAYSIAMLFAAAPERWAGWTIEIVGSDISRTAIGQARAGLYSQFEIQRGLPVRDLLRWFDPANEAWRIKPELRARVQFVPHNLLERAPHRPAADLVLCRNVMLYLSPAKRRIVFDHLAGAMAEDGVLMLGAGETALGQTELFEPDMLCRGIYGRAGRMAEQDKPALRRAG